MIYYFNEIFFQQKILQNIFFESDNSLQSKLCLFSRAESLASEIRDLQGELGDYNTVSLLLYGENYVRNKKY